MGRAPCCEKVGLKRGRWTAEEDKILTNYIQVHGEGSWRSLPKNAGLLRCGKSCRLRWINYLRTDLKRGNISDEEEEIIIKLHASLGNRWSLIAGHLPGRTDNEVKNYWNSHLSRNIKTFKTSRNQTLSPVAMDLAKAGMASKRRGGRTSRSAMKKKTNFPVKSSSKLVDEHKESKPVNVAVAMPPTPNLDKEALAFSSALSWQEEIENLTLTSPPYQVSEVELLGCGEQERESSNFLLWPGENEQNEFLGTNHEILDSEMLFLNAIVGNEERDPNDDVVAFSGKREENMNEGKLDWDRDCDGGFQGNELWCETDGLLSWLWEGTDNGEGDCNKQLGEEEMDSEKQNAMVEWLLS